MPQESRHAFDFEPTDPANVLQSPAVETHEKYAGRQARGRCLAYSRKRDDLADVDAAGTPVRHRSHGAHVLGERTLFGLPGDPLRNLSVSGAIRLPIRIRSPSTVAGTSASAARPAGTPAAGCNHDRLDAWSAGGEIPSIAGSGCERRAGLRGDLARRIVAGVCHPAGLAVHPPSGR